ncbi:hypothetical protein ACLBTZ_33105, partial [Pseudomonas aeruginosa]
MQVDEQRFGGIGRLYGREGLQRLADNARDQPPA